MLRKIACGVAVAVLTAGIACAAGQAKGKITRIEGDKVTVAVEGAVPEFAKTGATVTAGGGNPKVLSVKGSEVVLRFNRAKAAKLAVESSITIGEFDGDDLQGC